MKHRIALVFAIGAVCVQLLLIPQTYAQTSDSTTPCQQPPEDSARSVNSPATGATAQKSDDTPPAADSRTSGQSPAPASSTTDKAPPAANAGVQLQPSPSRTAATALSDSEWFNAGIAASSVDQLAPTLEHVRIASPTKFIPSVGPFSILIFKTYVDKDAPSTSGPSLERLTYRALLVSTRAKAESATCLVTGADFAQSILAVDIWPEGATRGTSSSPGTDFKADEPPLNKTLLHLDANIDWKDSWPWLWHDARIYILGTAGADGAEPRIVGSFETVIANKRWASILAILGCVAAYVLAALATYRAHRTQRVYDDKGNLPGAAGIAAPTLTLLERFRLSVRNPTAFINKGHGPLIGTNYKSVWAHLFNPVVLSAGPNGLGSATNLQILFFSLIVFGVVCYIWMMTGHLTGLSSTVVLLMGISGIGATAAAGADLATNRLTFDNWAWLINRGWLPPGGVAEVNAAKWKDIFTTSGSFDVYRFQMICFSVVVGVSIISVGTQANDLATFEVPAALLGILGLSQVVYVAGKLVAPPSISDLDAQISKLQVAEKGLRELNDTANATLAGTNVVTWTPDSTLSQAQKAYADYLETWNRTKTMFETTIGRLVPDSAEDKRPPFDLSDIILNKLQNAKVNTAYSETLILAGAPGAGPFTWTIESGTMPANMCISTAANNSDGVLQIPAADALVGEYRFTLRIRGANPSQTITKDFLLRIA
jgi:hypothetical protein